MTIHNGEEPAGSRPVRLQRKDPERSEPVRSARHHVDANGGWRETITGRSADKAEGEAAGDGQDTVGYGVKLGYKLIEDQILKGQKAAEQWHANSPDKETDDEWPRVLGRLLNVYRDLGSVYMDATESIISRVANLAMDYEPARQPEYPPAPGRTTADIPVVVASQKKVRIELDLKPQAGSDLRVQALHGLDAAAVPLTAIQFVSGPAGGAPELHIEIPSGCVASAYTGVVVDADTNEPMGTLSVHVLD